jgi:hypothetical protein
MGYIDLDRFLTEAHALHSPPTGRSVATSRRGAASLSPEESPMSTLYAPRDVRRRALSPDPAGGPEHDTVQHDSSQRDADATEVDLWVPGAERLPHPRATGGTYVDGAPWRFVFHTIEGEPSARSFRAAAAVHPNPPHLWAMPSADMLLQVIPLNRSAFALAHPPGTAETNRMRAIQVECWGYAKDMAAAAPEVLDWLADRVLGPVARIVPIDLTLVRGTGATECYGTVSACRMSDAEWRAFGGVCGHQHVPHNRHWDPGRLDLGRIAARASAGSAAVEAPPTEAEPTDDEAIHAGFDDTAGLGEAVRRGTARLEWIDLSLTTGSDGRPHLYYLMSGPPGGGASKMRLKISNPNAVRNFRTPTFDLRLRASTGPQQSRLVPLEGQGDQPWKRVQTRELADEESYVQEFVIAPTTRALAYDPDHPLCWLDAVYRWREGGNDEYAAQTSLAFFLVSPVELLVSQRRFVENRALDGPDFLEYRRFLYANSGPDPMNFTLRAQATVTDAATGQLAVTTSTSVTRGAERIDQTTATSELSAGFGIEKMFTLGQKLGTSVSTSIRWNEAVARQFTLSASRTRSFTIGHVDERTISGSIPAPETGRRNSLYAYPVVGVYDVPVVIFGGANALGQATTRRVDRVPVTWLAGWGTTVVTE